MHRIFFLDVEQPQNQLKIFKVENEKIEAASTQDCKNPLEIIENIVKNQESIVLTGKVLDFFEF